MGHIGRNISGKSAVSTRQSLPKAQALFKLSPSHSLPFENAETPNKNDERNTIPYRTELEAGTVVKIQIDDSG